MYRSLVCLVVHYIVHLNDNGMNYTGSAHNCSTLEFSQGSGLIRFRVKIKDRVRVRVRV